MEKLSPNRAQLFLRNKYTVFTMGGTVALRSVNKIFPESYSSAAILVVVVIFNLSSSSPEPLCVSQPNLTQSILG